MRRVLIVEDDDDMRTLQRMVLEGEGYEVVTAANGAEALAGLGPQASPCVILLDLMMPVMDGLTFLNERRDRGIARDVPVICVSAGGPELLAAARRLGAVACVPKPADLDQLCELVGKHCQREL